MEKENEEIHQHIIEENYRQGKKKQDEHFSIYEKAVLPEQLKENQASVINQLQSLHADFGVVMEPKWLQAKSEKTEQKTRAESLSEASISELLSSLQTMKAEEQDLNAQKGELLEKERELRSVLVDEISRKSVIIADLKSEVLELKRACEEISRALNLPVIS